MCASIVWLSGPQVKDGKWAKWLDKMVKRRGDSINPLSAIVAIWRHIIVSFQVFGTERVHWNLDFLGETHQWEVHWGKECLSIGGCRLNGLRGTSSPFCWHPPILASQEQLALRGLRASTSLTLLWSEHRTAYIGSAALLNSQWRQWEKQWKNMFVNQLIKLLWPKRFTILSHLTKVTPHMWPPFLSWSGCLI
jgi:hypothetical protein